ncbi:hypothetical protein ACIQI8_23650 [Streptomyces sp. NPDC092369]|uniref:hypothetical protein n=1 Tax=Streptomyces sp. NPDC092369 TaxID=3366015 RepID=UPI00381704A7
MTTAGALAALLAAAVLMGIALTIPGSGLGVRMEGTGTAQVPCAVAGAAGGTRCG